MENEAGVPVSGKRAARLPCVERAASSGTGVRSLSESLRLVGPKGTSLLCGCKWLLPPFPQGSHLVEGFFSRSCCLVPGSQLLTVGRESFRLCSSLPGWHNETRKGGSSSEQPHGHCLLSWLQSASMGQGPPPDSTDPYLLSSCTLLQLAAARRTTLWPLALSSQSDETRQRNDTGLKKAGLLPVAACWQ